MKMIWKIGLALVGVVFLTADARAGRWLLRDPIQEGAGFVARDPVPQFDITQIQEVNEPNLYAFVVNDPLNSVDPLGLVTVGFYGADTPFTFPNEGNVKMKEIANELGAPIYRSTAIYPAYEYLLKYFRNQPGCTNDEPIKIFRHSWGGISAVKLSRWIGRSELRNHKVVVAVIDPVRTLRLPPTSVPSNVASFWNRYQTHGNGVVILGRPVHGRSLTSYAQSSDQLDLNPGPEDNGIDHFSIIEVVKPDIIRVLR